MKRAKKYPAQYSHGYIDGGTPWSLPVDSDQRITQVSYWGLTPMREKVCGYMSLAMWQDPCPEPPGNGLKHLGPRELGADAVTSDPKMQHFHASVLNEGSGTQILSTMFAQRTAREAVRWAQPLTIMVRFAPRRSQRPMNEMFGTANNNEAVDPEGSPEGSLIDGDMGVFYTYLAMQGLSSAKESVSLSGLRSTRKDRSLLRLSQRAQKASRP